MAETKYDVIAIGNAIVDIIAQCDDAFLEKHDAPKGHMRLVDADTVSTLYDDMGPAVEISGGSAANTVVGVASLGGSAAFIGKVAQDDFGRVFAHDIKAAGVAFDTPAVAGGAPTARSLILVTPDGERTMNTFLGISPELDHGEIDPEMIAASKIVYLEGYLFDRDDAKAAFRQAATIARKAGRKVALTLSDGFCVDRHRDEFRNLIKNDIDILMANESEITSLYETGSFDEALRQAKAETELAALTRSGKGSIIISGNEVIEIAPCHVEKVVDTTGAGDLYAAGFLFGIAKGLPLKVSGNLGSMAAAEIISHIGARPKQTLLELAKSSGVL